MKTFVNGNTNHHPLIQSLPTIFSAELLIDQYRKKSQLYRTNVLFIQLGDDFRYRSLSEATDQFKNYDQLFNYINHRIDSNVEVKTLD